MTKKDIIQSFKKIIVPILKKNNVVRAGIFGSYARGEQKKSSDLDIIIYPPKGMGLGFIGLKLDLEKKLGKKVDLLTYKSLSPYLKKYILADEVRIL
jgi:predicted nucleotidyltransferase